MSEIIDGTWPYDGPHTDETVTSAAEALPRLVRYLNNATGPWNAQSTLAYAATTYRIVSSLTEACELLPQLLGQLADAAGLGAAGAQAALSRQAREMRAEIAELRTPAAVTPEPAGPRVWGVGEKVPADVLRIRDESGCLWSRDGAAWVHSCQDLGAVRSRMADSFLRVCVRTEVPAVPPAEPGAGA